MNKTERIQSMMIYLNDKKYFNLKDLMNEYQISKSTALRDIQSLEEIGMPIFSEVGRNGRYGLLNNKILSPIVFTIDEMYALYFSMLNIDNYETIPFDLDFKNLRLKFEAGLSKEYLRKIDAMKHVFKFNSQKFKQESKYLKEIVLSAIAETEVMIAYKKNEDINVYQVRFIEIESMYGQWYATGYDCIKKGFRVFRCDRIIQLKSLTNSLQIGIEELQESYQQSLKKDGAISFWVKVNDRGVDIFNKENYPSMELDSKENTVVGYYNVGEEKFIAKYFSQYGKNIISIFPNKLKQLIVSELSDTKDYIASL